MITARHKCGHEGCREAAVVLSEFCWDHIRDRELYKESFLRAVGESQDLSGCNLRKVSLKGILFEKVNLSGADLSQATLSGAHFFDSKLEGVSLVGADLSECDFTDCDLTTADLTKANMTRSRLWNSNLAGANLSEADMSSADFWNTRLHNIKLWHAVLYGAKGISKSSFAVRPGSATDCRINEDGERSAEDAYRQIKQLFTSSGRYTDASWASFKEKTMERRILYKKRSIEYIPNLVMNLLCGYGEKPHRIVLSAVCCILGFALLYGVFGAIESTVSPAVKPGWLDYIYYSTITYTTVGYGDFVPKPVPAFRMLAAAEAFLGVFLAGLFVFTLARKYSAR
jgi:uncharacterized protein YjbI with pentapeptide repeats